MLQQTQVASVIPYFERFLHRFPDVNALADADLQEVLKRWEGLGYYSRARHLQAAARCIRDDLGGQFPSSAAEWGRLPGVGDYTAAAIASIAFGERIPAIDGNVLRVGARVLGRRDNIRLPPGREAIRSWLTSTLRTVDPSAFNQALMELGALICRPKNPHCAECPLHRHCKARRQGLTGEIPFRPARATRPHYQETAAIIHDGQGRILLHRRPEKGLLGGMWEFPGARREGRGSLQQTLHRGITGQTGLALDITRKRGRVNHAFSHFSQTIHVFEGQVLPEGEKPGDTRTPPDHCWCTHDHINTLPLSKAHREIAVRFILTPG